MTKTTSAEQSILGAILCAGDDAMPILVNHGVDATWFSPPHQCIWTVAESLFGAGRPVEIVSVGGRLEETTVTDKAKLSRKLEDLADTHTTIANLPHLIHDLESANIKARADKAIKECAVLIKAAGLDTIRETVSEVSERFDSVYRPHAREKSLAEIGRELVDGWQSEEACKDHLPWPLAQLNRFVGPITDEFIFLAALESVGKTALAINIMLSLAQAGHTTSLASLESRRGKVVQRMIAILGQVNTHKLRQREALSQDYDRVREAAAKLEALPIRISDSSMTIEQLKAWAKLEAQRGSKLLIIDNMRHIKTRQSYTSPVEQFRDLSVKLKWIRDDVGLPLIVLHHLNQDGDVSWSKDIKRDADILLYMVPNEELSITPSKSNSFVERAIVDLAVRKNREGMRGFSVQAEFDKRCQTFHDYER